MAGRLPQDELIDVFQQLASQNDDAARDFLCEMRERLRAGLPKKSHGYALALIADAMQGSNASPKTFGRECIAQLSASYNHPPLGGKGAFSYEGPSWVLDTPNPPTLTEAARTATRRYLFSNAGSGGARVVGLLMCVRDADTGASVPAGAVAVQLAVNGDRFLVTNGTEPNFVNGGELADHDGAYFPFARLLSSRDFVDVNFRYELTAALQPVDVVVEFSFVMGPLPYMGTALRSARDFMLEAMRGSQCDPTQEFSAECQEQLWQLHAERERVPVGALSWESPTRLLEASENQTQGLVAIAPGGLDVTRRIEFDAGGGLIIGVMGNVLVSSEEGGVALGDNAFVSVQLQINGGETLNVNGRTPSFTPYAELFQASGSQLAAGWRQPFFPIRRLVGAADFIDVTWRTNVPAAQGITTVLPKFCFAFGRLSQSFGQLR